MSFLGLGTSICDVKIEFKDQENLKTVPCKNEQGDYDDLYLFTASENVAGTVLLMPKKKVDHLGVKLELIGQIEYLYDRANPYEFINVCKDLDGPGDLSDMKKYTFEFENVSKEHETYLGANVHLRYFLRVKVLRNYNPIQAMKEFAVLCCTEEPETNSSIKMEVGIEDCLHIEFEYNKTKYHLQDVVIGKIYFLLVRIKIKHMELVIIKRESTGTGNAQYNESENLAKYEIMDGAPVRGETIPVRLFLSPFDLSPTYKNVHNRFSVKYYLNLVLVDEEDRRYFKQQEIVLWRKDISTQKPEIQDDLTMAH